MPTIWKGNRRINVPDDKPPVWEETVKQEPETVSEPEPVAEEPQKEE